MRMVDVIDQKRNGGVLSDEQLQFFVDGVVDGSLPDYQISALLMAIYFQGMTDREQTQLTMKMMHSGKNPNVLTSNFASATLCLYVSTIN